MATYNQLPVYKATYDLLLYVYQIGKDVQRDYRYTLGETLKKDLIAILILIYRANSAPGRKWKPFSKQGKNWWL